MVITYAISTIVALCLVAVGYVLCLINNKIVSTGSIVLDKNEDGVDRVVFNLGMEYEDLADHKYIIFEVVKK